ncbi:protein kinase [Streptomyces sp. NPDC048219]|uniref:serine/threonine-protein kinase n=1 Tax=Streptomyces sp. NPDC048219 TaxID=3365517 RepID=UPI00371CDFFD
MRLRESARVMVSRCSAQVLSGRYRIDGLLGSGGAADVHRGFDLRLRRPVAVKVFRPEAGADLGDGAHSEAVILARLNHPGLVTAYDAGRHDGRVFLVMQLIEGSTLKHRIATAPLSPAATAELGAGLAQALAHAHDEGIVHRDVKPSNILLDASHRPYLTDFGISRLLDATTRTATGALTGTPAYLSPEQVLGRPVGRPADVYALGLVLLECLTGRLEYDGGPLEAAIARLHRPPVLPDHVPDQLADVLKRMTDLDELNRPTAHDCARILAGSVEGTTPETGPPALVTSLVADQGASQTADRTHRDESSGGERTARRPVTRGRPLVAGATVALAAVMATAFVATDHSASQGESRTRPDVTSAAPESSGSPSGAARSHPPASSAPAQSSDGGASAGPPSGDDLRPASHGPDREPGVDAASRAAAADTTAPGAPRATDPPAPATKDTTAPDTPRPPGQAKKAKKTEKAKGTENAEKRDEKDEKDEKAEKEEKSEKPEKEQEEVSESATEER